MTHQVYTRLSARASAKAQAAQQPSHPRTTQLIPTARPPLNSPSARARLRNSSGRSARSRSAPFPPPLSPASSSSGKVIRGRGGGVRVDAKTCVRGANSLERCTLGGDTCPQRYWGDSPSEMERKRNKSKSGGMRSTFTHQKDNNAACVRHNKKCVIRESNPGRPRGRRASYH